MNFLRGITRGLGRRRLLIAFTAIALNLTNIIGFFVANESPVLKKAVAQPTLDQVLTCEQAHTLALWGKERYRESRTVKLESSDFAEMVVTSFIEKLDPHRLLFTATEASAFEKAGEKAVKKWMTEKRCDFFDGWMKDNYVKAKGRFRDRLAAIPTETLFPATFPKSADVDSSNLKTPKFKAFASDEKELKERLTQWVKRIAAQSARELMVAYRNDKRKLIADTLDQMLFEFRPQSASVLAKAVLSAMDPYSTYFSPVEFEEFYFDLAGGTSGIGIRVRKVPDGLLVEKIVQGSAAQRSKRLREGDIITSVDGVRLVNLNATAAKHLLKGAEGSRVKLEIVHRPGEKPSSVRLSRRHFTFDDAKISKKLIEPKKPSAGAVAVIGIPSFYGRGGMISAEEERSSAEDLRQVLLEMLSQKKRPSAIVLDLRDNPGGFLEEAVTMAGFFLDGSPVVEVVESDGRRVLRPESSRPIYSGPLVVLVDQGTASASEVLAGALKDYQRAIIVGGKRTYGKGSVQKLFHLDDDLLQTGLGFSLGRGVVKLTTSVFYSPMGHTPANGGITSHISLPMKSDEEEVAAAPRRAIPEQAPFVDDTSIAILKDKEEALKTRLTKLEALSQKRTLDVREALKQVDADEDDEWQIDEAVSIALDYVSMDQSVAKNVTPSR